MFAVLLALAGCAGATDVELRQRPVALAQVSREERAACLKVASAVKPARCPTRLPDPLVAGLEVEGTGDYVSGGCGWLRSLVYEDRGGPVFHVLVGATCRPLPLDDVPSLAGMRDLLSLVGSGSLRPGDARGTDPPPVLADARGATTARGEPAVRLRFADLDAGTIHGGHDALVWNEDGAGWVMSLHFQPRVPDSGRLATMRAVAASFGPG